MPDKEKFTSQEKPPVTPEQIKSLDQNSVENIGNKVMSEMKNAQAEVEQENEKLLGKDPKAVELNEKLAKIAEAGGGQVQAVINGVKVNIKINKAKSAEKTSSKDQKDADEGLAMLKKMKQKKAAEDAAGLKDKLDLANRISPKVKAKNVESVSEKSDDISDTDMAEAQFALGLLKNLKEAKGDQAGADKAAKMSEKFQVDKIPEAVQEEIDQDANEVAMGWKLLAEQKAAKGDKEAANKYNKAAQGFDKSKLTAQQKKDYDEASAAIDSGGVVELRQESTESKKEMNEDEADMLLGQALQDLNKLAKDPNYKSKISPEQIAQLPTEQSKDYEDAKATIEARLSRKANNPKQAQEVKPEPEQSKISIEEQNKIDSERLKEWEGLSAFSEGHILNVEGPEGMESDWVLMGKIQDKGGRVVKYDQEGNPIYKDISKKDIEKWNPNTNPDPSSFSEEFLQERLDVFKRNVNKDKDNSTKKNREFELKRIKQLESKVKKIKEAKSNKEKPQPKQAEQQVLPSKQVEKAFAKKEINEYEKELLQPFTEGHIVNVVRSDGTKESDWIVSTRHADGRYIVVKEDEQGNELTKKIPAKYFEKWNPDPGIEFSKSYLEKRSNKFNDIAKKVSGEIKQEYADRINEIQRKIVAIEKLEKSEQQEVLSQFTEGNVVKVPRSGGGLEDDWVVSRVDKEGIAEVVKKDEQGELLVKKGPIEKLKKWNPPTEINKFSEDFINDRIKQYKKIERESAGDDKEIVQEKATELKKKLELLDKRNAQLISSASTWPGLFKTLNSIGELKTSIGSQDSNLIKSNIKKYLKGGPENLVTSKAGLRKKVKEFINKGLVYID